MPRAAHLEHFPWPRSHFALAVEQFSQTFWRDREYLEDPFMPAWVAARVASDPTMVRRGLEELAVSLVKVDNLDSSKQVFCSENVRM